MTTILIANKKITKVWRMQLHGIVIYRTQKCPQGIFISAIYFGSKAETYSSIPSTWIVAEESWQDGRRIPIVGTGKIPCRVAEKQSVSKLSSIPYHHLIIPKHGVDEGLLEHALYWAKTAALRGREYSPHPCFEMPCVHQYWLLWGKC